MQRLILHEYRRLSAVTLTAEQVVALRRECPSVSVSPSSEGVGRWDLTPDHQVGLVRLQDLTIEIRPKLPIERVLFLIAYALDRVGWKALLAEAETADGLYEGVIAIFNRLVAQAIRPGLLHGYRAREEDSLSVRGRILFAEQVARRQSRPLPVAVRYDDYTPDVVENQMLLAAARRLGRLPLRSEKSRRALRELTAAFERVSVVDFDPRRLPDVRFTRLNERYRPAIRLAETIFRSTSSEMGFGNDAAVSFLVDMNRVFEDFVYESFREALEASRRTLRQGELIAPLDVAGRVRLRPDLTLWRDGVCAAVADAKYKRLDAGIRNADVYQMTAYLLSTGLPRGTLIYAGDQESSRHVIARIGATVAVCGLDVSGPPGEVLAAAAATAKLALGAATLSPSRRFD